MTTEERIKMLNRYTVRGVPNSSIPRLMKELKLSEKRFYKFMDGQTCGLIGGELVYYPWDVEQFIRGGRPLD